MDADGAMIDVHSSTQPDASGDALAIDPHQPGAYQWWYFDATSSDGSTSLVVIFFVGSVFSPWYARRLARNERARPSEHCAVNIALYARGAAATRAWAFSEYDRFQGSGGQGLSIGRSGFVRDARGWSLQLDERAPWSQSRVRGTMRFDRTDARGDGERVVLDGDGSHRWHALAPRCRARASLEIGARTVEFAGQGYHDVNHGDQPLSRAFSRWTWARAHEPSGRTLITYDRTLVDTERRVLTLAVDAHGRRAFSQRAGEQAGVQGALVPGAWGLDEPRAIALEAGAPSVEGLARVDSSPFYARFTGSTPTGGLAVAEHLDLERFERPWVRALLPFRARRVERA